MRHLIALLVVTAACSKQMAPVPPTNSEPSTGSGAAGSAAAPFTDAYFKGPDAGGRGGAYAYTFCADGSYTQFCLDFDCDRGTWKHGAGEIVITSTNPDHAGKVTRLALGSDGTTLGDAQIGGPYTLQGPAGDRCSR